MTENTENTFNTLESIHSIDEDIYQAPIYPWSNAPSNVIYYDKIYDDGHLGTNTQSAEMAYKIGLSLDNYVSLDEVQESDIDGRTYLKDQCPMKSETDLQKEQYQSEITTLKKQLSATDYKAIKYAEGVLTDEEYQETGIKRQVWRARINELEELING